MRSDQQSPLIRGFTAPIKTMVVLLLMMLFSTSSYGSVHPNALKMPLSTQGRYIVDANGDRFKLKSVNWFGANEQEHAQEGLDVRPINDIVGLITAWGLNSVRLPFSNEMLRDTNPVNPAHVAANPQFVGMTPIQIFDETVEALTDAGLVVILNNHTTYSESCCGYDRNGLWYHVNAGSGQLNLTTTMWRDDWVMITNRYKNNKLVAGMDLRNEVRTMRTGDTIVPVNPNWASGDGNDWRRASKEAGIEILEANPDVLIVVEGINWTGSLPALGAYRPGLIPLRVDSVPLQESNKLVYGYHTYPFTGPRHNGDRTGGTSSGYNTYSDLAFNTSSSSFDLAMQEEWAYVLEEGHHYTAPVWISEFGAHWQQTINLPEFSHYPVWLQRFVDKLIEKDVGYAWWALNPGALGIATANYQGILPNTDWRYADLTRLFSHNGLTGQVPALPNYTQVQGDQADDKLSNHLRNVNWRPSHNQVTCSDSERLVGVSTNYRGLCTKDQLGDLWNSNRDYVVEVNSTSAPFPHNKDWADGFFRYECPQQHYVSGFSKRGGYGGFTGVLCAKASQPLGNQCHSVWSFGTSSRLSGQGGDWAPGYNKAQCGDDQYLAGVARRNSGSAPTVSLCCGIQEKPFALKGRWLSNRCMAIAGGVMQNGTNIEIRNCDGSDSQLWYYNDVTGQFRSQKDQSFCLDNGGQYNGNGGDMKIMACQAGVNQAFDFDQHKIRNRANRSYAVGAAGSGNNGTRVNIWSDVNASTQRWAEDFEYLGH